MKRLLFMLSPHIGILSVFLWSYISIQPMPDYMYVLIICIAMCIFGLGLIATGYYILASYKDMIDLNEALQINLLLRLSPIAIVICSGIFLAIFGSYDIVINIILMYALYMIINGLFFNNIYIMLYRHSKINIKQTILYIILSFIVSADIFIAANCYKQLKTKTVE